MVKDGNGRDIPNMEGCYFMNKKFLIPLVLVLLGVLIPVVYAANPGATIVNKKHTVNNNAMLFFLRK
jgi:hypothetical protein